MQDDSDHGHWEGDGPPPPELQEAIAAVFPKGACLPADEAHEAIDAVLANEGLAGWQVRYGPGATESSCVGAALDVVQSFVLLLPALPDEVRWALEGLRSDLLDQCVGADEAARLLTTVLEAANEDDFIVDRTGLVGGPVSDLRRIEEHVASGCFIYSGTGLDPSGRRIYYLAGPNGG